MNTLKTIIKRILFVTAQGSIIALLVLCPHLTHATTIQSLAQTIVKGMDDYFGTHVSAQSFNAYTVAITTKCAWRVAAIHSGVSQNNYPNPPLPGSSLFWRNTCQDENGLEYPAGDVRKLPPACETLDNSIGMIDAGVTCYPTGITMDTAINGRATPCEAGCGPGGGAGGGGGSSNFLWNYMDRNAIVGVCERTCIWENNGQW